MVFFRVKVRVVCVRVRVIVCFMFYVSSPYVCGFMFLQVGNCEHCVVEIVASFF
jgi:hypothetical protein